MGLDQYLIQEQNFYVAQWATQDDEPWKAEAESARRIMDAIRYPGEDVRNVEIRTTVLQWRKANAIHNWFVREVQDGVDDCGYHYVDEEKLAELRDLCIRVIDNAELAPDKIKTSTVYDATTGPRGRAVFEDGLVMVDTTLAEELLPTASGFFFGSTDYNEWYIEELKYTRDGIERVLENLPDRAYLHYSSSW